MREEDGNHFVARAKKSAHAGQSEDVNIEPAGRVLKTREKQQLVTNILFGLFSYICAPLPVCWSGATTIQHTESRLRCDPSGNRANSFQHIKKPRDTRGRDRVF